MNDSVNKEVNMVINATSITEYYTLVGEARGYKIGLKLGELRGQIHFLESLLRDDVITSEVFNRHVTPLRPKLTRLEAYQSAVTRRLAELADCHDPKACRRQTGVARPSATR